MLETDALKEKLEMEIHRFARPPEELSSGDPYFEQLQTMLAIREELENIPLCDIQRDMLLAMENVLESAWLFRNTPVPDRCMNPNNISEVVYYFLQDKGAEYRGDLLYERAKAEFDARMEELAALPPKEILDHAYEKIIKEDFLCHLEEGLDEWETDALLSYPQPLAALYTEWMGVDYSYLDIDRIQSTAKQAAGKRLNELRHHEFDVNGEPPAELRYFYDLHSEILDNPDLEWVGDIRSSPKRFRMLSTAQERDNLTVWHDSMENCWTRTERSRFTTARITNTFWTLPSRFRQGVVTT